MHFLTFGLLTLLLWVGFYRASRPSVSLARVAGLASGYGFLIEVYQGILPGRAFGLDDLVWNTVGVLVFLALVKMAGGGGAGGRRRGGAGEQGRGRIADCGLRMVDGGWGMVDCGFGSDSGVVSAGAVTGGQGDKETGG